jgi:hypothetical protein
LWTEGAHAAASTMNRVISSGVRASAGSWATGASNGLIVLS